MIRPFINNATWADKVEVHNNERKTSTYFNQARIAEQLESTGRFAEQARPSIVGETPAVHYPAAASPWSGPQVGLEPPTGEALGDAPVVGEPHEVIRAAEVLAARELADAVGPAGSSALRECGDDPSMTASAIPALTEVSFPSSVKEAEPADPAVPVVDRGSAIHAEVETKLKALLGRGLVRRRKL